MIDDHGNPKPGQQRLAILDNATSPPATRAECADIQRPCNRYACKYHLWPQTERAGRPHHGNGNTFDGVADALADGARESCALDVAERGEHDNVQVAASFPPRPLQRKRTERIANDVNATHEKPTPGITKERIRQIAERGLDKQWGALSFVQAFETFITEFTDAGGDVDFLWGTIVDDEGFHVERHHDASRIWVTLSLNCSKVVRPRREEVREMKRMGVAVRRKS